MMTDTIFGTGCLFMASQRIIERASIFSEKIAKYEHYVPHIYEL